MYSTLEPGNAGGNTESGGTFSTSSFLVVPSDIKTNPWLLIMKGLWSVVTNSLLLPKILQPVFPQNSGPLDELYPSPANLKALGLHGVLALFQILLFATLPTAAVLFWFLLGVVLLAYIGTFIAVTWVITRLLNGSPQKDYMVGEPDREPVNEEGEVWFFISGICTGKTWLQSNLDLLAKTFQREIIGIHDRTFGVFLDLIECLIQRDLGYQTRDIRLGLAAIRAALSDKTTKKIVLVLHSQGAIEGSNILDTLLADLPSDDIAKMEIYTFGNAARHFNNPLRTSYEATPPCDDKDKRGPGQRIIKYVEHYANKDDFVASIGVLKFGGPVAQVKQDANPFFGSVFVRNASGHLLNMHYLDTMFTMINGEVDETGNEFMNSLAPAHLYFPGLGDDMFHPQPKLIKDVSRLWQYRNGKRPQD